METQGTAAAGGNVSSASAPSYKPTINTFVSLLEAHFASSIRFNELANRPEALTGGEWQPWTDTLDATLREFFSSQYGLTGKANLLDAFLIFLDRHKANPLTDEIKSLQWDGRTRIHSFLTEIMGAERTDYTEEVSRLVFAGGIHRAFRPGCKFDDVPVLIGSQGGGKSTVVRWLAIRDEWFRELKVMTGKESIEALAGGWICEIAELLAMTRAKEVEAVKAYITTQTDTYRMPYARNVSEIKRRVSFIGTTNNEQFLTDNTGNRRFYPVKVTMDGYALADRETEARAYIRQCWAEAYQLFLQNKLKPYADARLLGAIRQAQEQASEDDWRVGAIQEYCERKSVGDFVYVLDLWFNALKMDMDTRPTRKESMEINQIVQRIPGWVSTNRSVSEFGHQRGYVKKAIVVHDVDVPF